MAERAWTLENLSDGRRVVRLSVDSKVVSPLIWIWTAEVSVEDNSGESKFAIGPADYTAEGMPDGDTLGSSERVLRLTGGVRDIPRSDFEATLMMWEKECREHSVRLDAGVARARDERERRNADEERRSENRRSAEGYLDSLIDDPSSDDLR